MRYRDHIDTDESRRRHAGSIRFVSAIHEPSPDPRRSGFVYSCPRCQWSSRVFKWRLGAEHAADRHALVCRPRRNRLQSKL